MKKFLLRSIVFTFLIFVSSFVGASDEANSAAQELENEISKLCKAIKKNDLNEVKRRYFSLVKQGNRLKWICETQWNPLALAMENLNPEVVDFFLDVPNAKEWLKEKTEFFGATPIHWIVRINDLNLLKKIMAFSEMEELLNQGDIDSWTPFQMAVKTGKIELVQFLLKYPQVQAQLATINKVGYSILHSAVYSENLNMVEIIFGFPAARALIFEKDFFGETVLDIAVSRQIANEILIYLLSLPEASQLISLRHSDGGNALHHAHGIAFLQMARFLESRPEYLDLLREKNLDGRAPFSELFSRENELDLTEFFALKHFESLLFEKDERGQNLAHAAVRKIGIKTSHQLATLAKNPKKLFAEPDSEGTSPLGLAVKLRRTEIVGALLAEGFDFENVLINHKRVSAIEYLSQNRTGEDSEERMELLQFLLSRPAEESQTSGWGPPK